MLACVSDIPTVTPIMKDKKKRISVELGREEQDFLQRLGLESLLNSKYGPSIKMMWARLVENRVPIFFGGFLISTIVASGMTWRLYTVDKYNNEFRVENAALQQELELCRSKSLCGDHPLIVEFYKPPTNIDPAALDRLSAALIGETDLSKRYGELDISILHCAISCKVQYLTITRLIDAGADPNAQINSTDRSGQVRHDRKGNTVLVSLIRHGRFNDALRLLNDYDIDTSVVNFNGNNAYKVCLNLKRTRFNNQLTAEPDLERLIEVLNPKSAIVISE